MVFMLQPGLQSYGQFDAGHRIRPVVWPHFDLLVLHEGELRLKLLGGDYFHLVGGDAILIFPNTPFEGDAVSASAKASVHHFTLSDQPVEMREPLAPLDHLAGKEHGYEIYRAAVGPGVVNDIDRLVRLSEPQLSLGPSGKTMRMTLLLLMLIQLREAFPVVAESPATTQSRFSDLMRWASTRLESHPTVSDMARRAQLSESHFRRAFAQETGQTAGRYLLSLRMTRARRLLRETRMPIKQVAQSVGYASVIAFHHAFATQVGGTPAQYRKNKSPRG